jgi:hypothetical protein
MFLGRTVKIKYSWLANSLSYSYCSNWNKKTEYSLPEIDNGPSVRLVRRKYYIYFETTKALNVVFFLEHIFRIAVDWESVSVRLLSKWSYLTQLKRCNFNIIFIKNKVDRSHFCMCFFKNYWRTTLITLPRVQDVNKPKSRIVLKCHHLPSFYVADEMFANSLQAVSPASIKNIIPLFIQKLTQMKSCAAYWISKRLKRGYVQPLNVQKIFCRPGQVRKK